MYYHGRHHAVDVLDSAKMIAKSENVTLEEINLLLVAAAYHDCGFLNKYKNHEEESCEIARAALPKFGFDNVSVVKVCDMIMATKVPQNPRSKIAEILCDADLDYIGTNRFKRTGDQLYDELIARKAIPNRETWDHIQVKFLSTHRYYTKFSKENRQPTKELHIVALKKTLGLAE